MWFDICILGLINERSCSPGGKSHTGRFGGLCWRLEPWRKASSCVSWRSTQVGSCCSPHLNLYSLKSPAFFLPLPKVTRNCVYLVLRLWIIWHDSFHLHWILKAKLFFFPHLSIRFYGSPRFLMLRWGHQVHKEGKRGRYGHLVKVWTTDDAPCDLLGLKTPRCHISSFRRRDGNSWLRVLTVMEILMCGIELWYWEFNTSMAQFPVSNYI